MINSDARIMLGEEISAKIDEILDTRLHAEERTRILLTLIDEPTVSDDEYWNLKQSILEATA